MSLRNLCSLGSITKKEKLSTTDQVNDKSVLVFETGHPYSGYYGTTVPDSTEPMSLFLTTKHQYNDDKIIRAIQTVKTRLDYDFDAVPGSVTYGNRHLGIIRIRCLSYNHIAELAEEFRSEGVDFMPYQKFPPFEGIIRITKYFNTVEEEEGIYIDQENKAFAYLRIDKNLRWNTFENVYADVRNNLTGFTFDAALATMYDNKGIIDFVRIYDEKRSVDHLRQVRKTFLDVLNKY